MKKFIFIYCIIQVFSVFGQLNFEIPTTVCLGNSFQISNVNSNASAYEWNFCKGNNNLTFNFRNLGNLGGVLNIVNNHDVVFDGTNYIEIITNYNTGSNNVMLANYGGNIQNNTPSLKNLTPFITGVSGRNPLSLKIIKDGTNWYCFMIYDGSTPGMIRLNFGNSLLNNPTTTIIGNLGISNMYTYDFDMVKDGNNFYAFVGGVAGSGLK